MTYNGTPYKARLQVVSALKVHKLLTRGSDAYMCNVMDTHVAGKPLTNTQMVRDFPCSLPKDVPGLPPPREVEFSIDLAPGVSLISKALDRMTLEEL